MTLSDEPNPRDSEELAAAAGDRERPTRQEQPLLVTAWTVAGVFAVVIVGVVATLIATGITGSTPALLRIAMLVLLFASLAVFTASLLLVGLSGEGD